MADMEMFTTSSAVLGQILAKLRSDAGKKQNEFANEIDVGASTWSRIENGESGLSIDQLRRAAKALGVSPGEILDLAETAERELEAKGVRVDTAGSAKKKAREEDARSADENRFDDFKSVLGTASVGASAAMGAALGSAVPIVGTTLGAMLGGALGLYMQRRNEKK